MSSESERRRGRFVAVRHLEDGRFEWIVYDRLNGTVFGSGLGREAAERMRDELNADAPVKPSSVSPVAP
jgi:hypothetical protein